jgi:hypothetical protein
VEQHWIDMSNTLTTSFALHVRGFREGCPWWKWFQENDESKRSRQRNSWSSRVKFQKNFNLTDVPDRNEDDIRLYAGSYAILLSLRHLEFARKHGRVIKISGFQVDDHKIFESPGLKSRFFSSKVRLVHLINTRTRDIFELTDTLCDCDGGLHDRSVCAQCCDLTSSSRVEKSSRKPALSDALFQESFDLSENESDVEEADGDSGCSTG